MIAHGNIECQEKQIRDDMETNRIFLTSRIIKALRKYQR